MNKKNTALVLVSGGLDSSTCIGMAVDKFGSDNVCGLTIYYGQKNKREIQSAKSLINHYKIDWIQQDLAKMFKSSNCSLLLHSTNTIPKGSYNNQLRKDSSNPVSTYVPFRNGLFLSVAASIALSKRCSYIYYGIHKDDAAYNAYPDCSREFHKAINEAIYQGSGKQLTIVAPFVELNKADIVKIGLKLDVPYHFTWSCYEGKEKPCGECATCLDRSAAFHANGVIDPIEKHYK